MQRNTPSSPELDPTAAQLRSMFALVARLLEGHVLAGRYALERALEDDAFGSTYEATDLEQRVPVQVRVFRTLRQPGMAGLQRPGAHPHALDVLDIGVTDLGLAFSVMEPSSGESLGSRLRRGKTVAPADALAWGLAVGEALAAAHDRGDAHGFVCADAVFIHRADMPGQTAKLRDFEVAGLVPPTVIGDGPVLARLGPCCSPERIAGAPPGPAGDVFAHAVLVGQLSSGSAPPPDPDPEALRGWLRDALPAPLRERFEAALHEDPARRPALPTILAALRARGEAV